jgi:hypothetical protein
LIKQQANANILHIEWWCIAFVILQKLNRLHVARAYAPASFFRRSMCSKITGMMVMGHKEDGTEFFTFQN